MISKNQVQHISKLARLELTEREIEKMQKDLSAILDYFNVLKKAPKKRRGLTPSDFDKQIRADVGIRSDVVVKKPVSSANNLVAMAPDKKEGYIKVKAVL